MKLLKPVFISLLMLFSITLLTAQSSNDWTTYHEDNQVKIEYTYSNCEYIEQFNSEFLVIKISNYTNNEITINWKEELWYNNNCINCESDSDESNKQIIVAANTTIQGNCTNQNALRIFSKFTEDLAKMPGVDKIVSLTEFQLKNLNISKNE